MPGINHNHNHNHHTMTNTTTTKPACIAQGLPEVGIYIACLAAYNSGIRHGAWIDLEECQDKDDIDAAQLLQAGIAWVLATSPEPGAEEWAVHDSSGLPSYLSNTEWPDLGELMSWVNGLSAYVDEDWREAYLLECERRDQTIDDDAFRQTYCGWYKSEENFAIELAEELGVGATNIDFLFDCIDWERAWRNLTRFDYRSDEPRNSGGVHIFKNN
jgi:antirestriction protein